MAKQIKKKIQIEQNKINVEFQPRIPVLAIIGVLVVWFYFVITNYYKNPNFQVNFDALSKIIAFPQYFVSTSSQEMVVVLLNHLICLGLLLLIVLSSFGLGRKIWRLLKLEDKFSLTDIFFSLGLGFTGTILFIMLIGWLGLLYALVVWIFVIVFGGIGVWEIFGLYTQAKQTNTKYQFKKLNFWEMLCILIVLLTAIINLVSALTPETFYDSLVYQLTVPWYWVQHHRIETIPTIHMSYYPMNVHLLYVLALILKNEILVKLVHFMLGLFTVFGIYVFCKKYFSRQAGLIAAIIFYTVPLVMFVSWRSAIELGLAFFETLAVISFVSSLSSSDEKQKFRWWMISAVFAGMAVAGKYNSVLSVGSFLIVYTIRAFFVDKEKFVVWLKRVSVFVFLVFVVVSPWCIRNTVVKHNPLYPFSWQKDVSIDTRGKAEEINDPPRMSFTPQNILTLPWGLTMGKVTQEGYSGAAFLTLILLPFLFGKIKKPMKILIFYFLIYFLEWFGLRPYLRYFIPALPVLAIILGCYASEMNVYKWAKNIVFIVITLLCLSNLYFGIVMQKHTMDPYAVAIGMQKKIDYLGTQRPTYPCAYYQALDWANHNLDKTGKILFLGEARGYYSQLPFISNTTSDYNTLLMLAKESNNEDELWDKLKQQNIRYFLLNVPECIRLKEYDIFPWEGDDLKVFIRFWNKYVKESYKECGHFYNVPLDSDFWKQYITNPLSYTYIYQIMDKNETRIPSPMNVFAYPFIYSKKMQEKISMILEQR